MTLAQTQAWNYCPPSSTLTGKLDPAANNSDDGEIKVSADALETLDDRTMRFTGSVSLQQGDQSITANQIKIFDQPRRIEASGSIEALTGEFRLQAKSAELDADSESSRFLDVNYEFSPRHAYGSAQRITQKGKVLSLDGASYSTCLPSKRDWEFTAGHIKLDPGLGIGYATNALFKFKSVPFIYLPAITFPINNKRRSGVLVPSFRNADETGTEVITPFYWDISPAQDLQITPRFMSRRGAMLQNKYRYLGNEFAGEIRLDYLNDDKLFNQDRYFYALKHKHQLARRWRIDLKGSVISDNDYFADFSGGLTTAATTHLERKADFIFASRHLQGLLRAQAFQTVDDSIALNDRPYQRLPQISLEGLAPLNHEFANLSMNADFTRFIHPSLPDASRLNLAPTINLSWITPGAYIKPALSWHITRYDFYRQQNEIPSSLTRDIPVASIDSGLFFERTTQSGDIHTLEPRLYYLNAPFRQQDNIPIFDSDEPAFIFSSLFRDNRFSGLDRIGDANQMTLALSSRVLKKTDGRQKFSASIGQIYYFDKQRVTLPGETRNTENRSDLAAELAFKPDAKWSMRGSLISDNKLDSARVATARVRYRNGGNKIFNLEHRFHRDDDIDQTNLSAVWPINRNWRFLGRWLYSHESRDDLEVLTGLEYESCCWKARLLNRRYVINDEGEYNDSIYVQLVLKGLASLGTGNSVLETSIPGYVLNDD